MFYLLSELRYTSPWILFFMTEYKPRKGRCFLEIASELILPQLFYLLGSKGVGVGEGCSTVGLHKLTGLLRAGQWWHIELSVVTS